MEFSTSKQSLPSNQFNMARLKPTHIHQFWLDWHCDPDACSDGPAGASIFSGRRRGQRSPAISFPRLFLFTLLSWDFLGPDKRHFNIFELLLCLFRWGSVSYPKICNQISLITASYDLPDCVPVTWHWPLHSVHAALTNGFPFCRVTYRQEGLLLALSSCVMTKMTLKLKFCTSCQSTVQQLWLQVFIQYFKIMCFLPSSFSPNWTLSSFLSFSFVLAFL